MSQPLLIEFIAEIHLFQPDQKKEKTFPIEADRESAGKLQPGPSLLHLLSGEPHRDSWEEKQKMVERSDSSITLLDSRIPEQLIEY